MPQWVTQFAASDWIALAALGVAVFWPFIVYWLGRRYTDKQFEVTNFPEVTFEITVVNDETPMMGSEKIVVPVYIQVKAKTVTQVEAVGLQCRITLAKGLRQVWWNELKRDRWAVLAPYKTDPAYTGWSLQEGVVTLLPNIFEMQVGSAKRNMYNGWPRQFLRLKTNALPPPILMLVHFDWSPPLRTKKHLSYDELLELYTDVENQEVKLWGAKKLSSRFMRLRVWRPVRMELRPPNRP